MGSQNCWKHQILPTCAGAGRAYVDPFSPPLMALVVVECSRYSLYVTCCAQRGYCAVAGRVLIGQLGFGLSKPLHTTWHGRVGGSGPASVLPCCELQPLAGVLTAKIHQGFPSTMANTKTVLLASWPPGTESCALPCTGAILPTHWDVAFQSTAGRGCFLFLSACPHVGWRKGRRGEDLNQRKWRPLSEQRCASLLFLSRVSLRWEK